MQMRQVAKQPETSMRDIPAREVGPEFQSAMRGVGASVAVVTASHDGTRSGLTATAILSLSMSPPSVIVCVNRTSSFYSNVKRLSRFGINFLSDAQEEVARKFSSGVHQDERFAAGRWTIWPDGTPRLEGAAAALLCSADREMDYGTHAVVIGLVDDVIASSGAMPLIYQNGRYLHAFGLHAGGQQQRECQG